MKGDSDLIQIVDAAMAEAVRKSGAWIACRIGCYQCCAGPFPISPLDAQRLREGLADLELQDPERARHLRDRARAAAARLREDFPGDTLSAVLADDDAAADQLCPALDPETGACDLYAVRPITCRTFGPAVSAGDGAVAACELCYDGATDEQIAACAVEVDLDQESEEKAGASGDTLVAFALLEAS